jgi:hypothetical protein
VAVVSISNTKTRIKTSDLAHAWFDALRDFINAEQCGHFKYMFGGKGHPVFTITQAEFDRYEEWFNLPWQERPRRFYIIKNKALNHRHVQRTLDGQKHYFTGSLGGLSLIMVEADAHEDWQTDGAETRYDLLCALGAENVFEGSTERGTHLYLKFRWAGHGLEKFRKVLARFQGALKRLTRHRRCTVEVKGQPGVSRDRYGLLATLPCWGRASERLEDFRRAPVLTLEWIAAVTERLESMSAKSPHATKVEKARERGAGSTTGTSVPAEELARLPEMVADYRASGAGQYLYCRRQKVRGKADNSAEDFCIALGLTALAAEFPKGQETPKKFIELLWKHAYEDKLVERQFHNGRWAAIWRTLAAEDILDVADTDYWAYSRPNEDGKKGRAMRWRLRPEYNWYAQKARGADIGITKPDASSALAFTPSQFRHKGIVPTRVAPPDEEQPWLAGSAQVQGEEEALEAVMCTAGAFEEYEGEVQPWRPDIQQQSRDSESRPGHFVPLPGRREPGGGRPGAHDGLAGLAPLAPLETG